MAYSLNSKALPRFVWRYGKRRPLFCGIPIFDRLPIYKNLNGLLGVQKGRRMNSLFCGIDFHKNTCSICIVDETGKVIESHTKLTSDVVKFLSTKKFVKIGVEASGGVNDFASRLITSGHKVDIIDPKAFRLVGMNGKKTDKKDARAIAECLRLNFIPKVHLKSLRSRELKSLLMSREMTVTSRVNICNHIRGTLREYGLPIPAGKDKFFEEVVESISKVENGYLRVTLFELLELANNLIKKEAEIEKRIKELNEDDAKIKRLQTVPGIGLMTSTAMVSVIDDISRFKKASDFASYVGLVPGEKSSGEKRRMGSITKSGSEILRRYLIHGARSVLMHAHRSEDPNLKWALKLKERVGMNKATVALAHRMARIAFCILRDETTYGEIKKDHRADAAKNFSGESSTIKSVA